MRAAFDEARKNAPSIIFLDEIDAVGDRARFNDHNSDYSTQVVAALLECIDGAEGREGVVVVGACNYPEPARCRARPGRSSRPPCSHPTAGPGGKRGHPSRWHLQGQLPGVDLADVAARTEGWNGASLEQLVRQARRLARRGRREMTVGDLLSGVPEPVTLPEALRRRMAIHEAGHAVIGLLFDAGEVISASIATTIMPQAGDQNGGGVTFREIGFRERTRARSGRHRRPPWRHRSRGNPLGGSVGRGGRIGGVGPAWSDVVRSRLRGVLRLRRRVRLSVVKRRGQAVRRAKVDRFLQLRVDKVLAGQFDRAKKIVEGHRQEVERIAEALLVKGALTGEEIRALAGKPQLLKLVVEARKEAD